MGGWAEITDIFTCTLLEWERYIFFSVCFIIVFVGWEQKMKFSDLYWKLIAVIILDKLYSSASYWSQEIKFCLLFSSVSVKCQEGM